ncbi:MAG: M64 family metallo-endopeptidase [Bacteroidetes bacterium]|nr:M64 family metallo-endopeptidase [Bacteroidota bacterium]
MKCLSIISFIALTLTVPCETEAQDNAAMAAVTISDPFRFDDFFLNKTLRIDYFLSGDQSGEHVFFREMREEPSYGGPHHDLLALKNTGTYRYILIDSASGELMFSKGFCSLFQEWQGTPEAKEIRRAFPMVAVMPFPIKTAQFIIEKRSYETGAFEKLFEMRIRPDDYYILKDSIHRLKVENLLYSGDPSDHVDVAFLAEGYTETDMPKFIADARSMVDYLLSVEPYSNFRDKFNFYAVRSPSDESGVTIPGKELYVNTNIHSSFYTFGMDRYLTSFDTKAIYDIAANVPYDAIFVLVNSKRYGGGGFYNHYCEGTVDNQYSKVVAVHEFGHSFAGLADEYFNAEVTYTGFYNPKVEPWEQNITTNNDFASKWQSMIPADVPVPTPRDSRYQDVIGMFEGGGYVRNGVYSPFMDCRMKSNEAKGFCPVCQKAIIQMIRYYSGTDKSDK